MSTDSQVLSLIAVLISLILLLPIISRSFPYGTSTHSVTTKCISAGLISSLGNVLAQKITHFQKEEEKEKAEEGKPFQVDLAQVSRFALLNMAFVAPVLHHWYNFINRAVPGTSIARVLQRTFWDEFVFSPVYVPIFLGMLWKLEGSSNENIWKMTKSEVPSIIVAEWITWVPTMLVTFRYVPIKFQVLVINVVGVVWQTFLAYMASNAHAREAVEDTVDKVTEREQTFRHRGGPMIAATSMTTEVDSPETAADCSAEESESETRIPPSVIVEERICPMVLNTIVRHETPKYIELDYMITEDDFQQNGVLKERMAGSDVN
jgi:Mpv17 / PMP22 family